MKIMGSKFFGHDSAIFVLDTEKEEIFAMSTERVTRIKHDWADVGFILEEYSELIKDIDYVCHGFADFEGRYNDYNLSTLIIKGMEYERLYRKIFKPLYIKERFESNINDKYKIFFKTLFINPSLVFDYFLKKKRFEKGKIKKIVDSASSKKNAVDGFIKKILKLYNIFPREISYYEHHKCHAIASYYFSKFCQKNEEAMCLTLDGWGDGYFSKLFKISNDNEQLIGHSKMEVFYLNDQYCVASIGEIYGSFTQGLGFRKNSDEGKVEALAAFSEKNIEVYNELKNSVSISRSGFKFKVDKIKKFYDLNYIQTLESKYGKESVAAALQDWLEDTVVEYLNLIYDVHQVPNLCLSGGVAANIILSLNIYERTKFNNIFVLPFMGDEGVSAGSAILKAKELGIDLKWLGKYYMPYLGDSINNDSLLNAFEKFNSKIIVDAYSEDWHHVAANAIHSNKIIALVNGRMEFGPRALGNRSILANSTNKKIKDIINLKVKKRPKFQPFCPSILEEDRLKLFKKSFEHKHMAIAFRVKEEHYEDIPSAIHVDGTARPQFVKENDNPDYYKVIKNFKDMSGVGCIIDTSFNLHGRTIVRTAEDAITDFLDCDIDELYINGYRVRRK